MKSALPILFLISAASASAAPVYRCRIETSAIDSRNSSDRISFDNAEVPADGNYHRYDTSENAAIVAKLAIGEPSEIWHGYYHFVAYFAPDPARLSPDLGNVDTLDLAFIATTLKKKSDRFQAMGKVEDRLLNVYCERP